jgi:hypothetical protein
MGNILKFNRLMKQAASEKGQTEVIKIKAGQMLDSYNVLVLLAQQQVSARVAFKLSRVLQGLARQMDAIEAERIALCQKYGTLPEGEANYTFEPEARTLFDAEAVELQSREIIIKTEQLTLDEIGDLKINGVAMFALAPFINAPEEVETEDAPAPDETPASEGASA